MTTSQIIKRYKTPEQGLYYNLEDIKKVDAIVKAIVSCRGLGKTYGVVNYLAKKAIEEGTCILYLVENEPMLKELIAGDAAKFVAQLYDNFDPEDITYKQSTVYFKEKPLFMLYDLAHYGKAKRTKHVPVKYVIFDEFIELSTRIKRFNILEAFNSLVQSVIRLQGAEIWLLGNTETPNSPFVPLVQLDKQGHKGCLYKLTTPEGLTIAVHYVDAQKQYPKYYETYKNSVSGMLGSWTGQTNLLNNDFGSVPSELYYSGTIVNGTPFKTGARTLQYKINEKGQIIIAQATFGAVANTRITIDRYVAGFYHKDLLDRFKRAYANNRLVFADAIAYTTMLGYLSAATM